MAINFPGPYQLRWQADWDGVVHNNALNLILAADPTVGTPFASINVVMRNSVNKALATVVAELAALLQPFYDPAQTVDNFTLWKYQTDSFEADFISGDTTSVAGTNAGVVSDAFYVQYTFRTQEGGIMFIKLQECRITTNSRRSYAGMGAQEQALVDYCVADTTPFVARDTSYPVLFSRSAGGTDERLWRKRYRA